MYGLIADWLRGTAMDELEQVKRTCLHVTPDLGSSCLCLREHYHTAEPVIYRIVVELQVRVGPKEQELRRAYNPLSSSAEEANLVVAGSP